MPIEIRELVIRAIVDPAAAGNGGCGGETGSEATAPRGPDPDLVQACVAEVMRQLRRAMEP